LEVLGGKGGGGWGGDSLEGKEKRKTFVFWGGGGENATI